MRGELRFTRELRETLVQNDCAVLNQGLSEKLQFLLQLVSALSVHILHGGVEINLRCQPAGYYLIDRQQPANAKYILRCFYFSEMKFLAAPGDDVLAMKQCQELL